MKAQAKALVASLIIVALGLSAVSGITYSWFSASEDADVTVKTGYIDLDVGEPNIMAGSGGYAYSGTITLNATNVATLESNAEVKVKKTATSPYQVIINNAAPGDYVSLTFDDIKVSNSINAYYYEKAESSSDVVVIDGVDSNPEYLSANTSPHILYGGAGGGSKTVTIKIPTTASLERVTCTASFSFNAIQFNAPIDTTSMTSTISMGTNVFALNTSSSLTSESVAVAFEGTDGLNNKSIEVAPATSAEAASYSSVSGTTVLAGVTVTPEAGVTFVGVPVKLTFVLNGDYEEPSGVLSGVTIYHGNAVFSEGEGESIYASYDDVTGKTTVTVVTKQGFSSYFLTIPGVAKIGNDYYSTLAEAFDVAMTSKNPVEIDVLANSGGDGIAVASGSVITVDFNGYTYELKNPMVGSTGTETNAFQLLKGSKVTFNDGILKSSVAKILIQNYCDLTLDNMVLDGSEVGDYTLSNNNGNTLIKNTKIIAKEGAVALDVYGGWDHYPIGPSVKICGSSIIDGVIEIDKDEYTESTTQNLTIEAGVSCSEMKVYGIIDGNKDKVFVKIDPSVLKNMTITGEGAIVSESFPYITSAENLMKYSADITAGKMKSTPVFLVADIDIQTETWTPINIKNTTVTYMSFDGLGHKIVGLKNAFVENVYGTDVIVKNLTLENSNVTTGYGTTAGILLNYVQWSNIELTGCNIVNSTLNTGNADLRVGALIGGFYTGDEVHTIAVSDCGLKNVKMTAKGSVGGVVGQFEINKKANVSMTDVGILDNCVFVSTDDGEWRVGGLVGTLNAGGTIQVSGCGISDSFVRTQGDKTPNDREEYGRIVANSGSSIIIDGQIFSAE